MADHDAYVARPEAVMTISAVEFGSYTERSSAVETGEGHQAAIFTNISDDPRVRREFWLAVHEHEREAKPDKLVFHKPRLSSAEWRKIADIPALPREVRELAASMATMPSSIVGTKGDAALLMDRAEAAAALGVIRDQLQGWNWKTPPVVLSKGRNGRTQFRITAEFPQGLDAGARFRIGERFCEEFRAIGVMFTAAIHEPDHHNDERNHHLHLVYYDRPCRIMPDSGAWDFTVREKVAGQHERYRYPHRQPKIAELARDPKGGAPFKYRASIIFGWRERFAELCNEELRDARIDRLFDARSYNKMGIDQQPTKPLGPKAAPLEAVGIPTSKGILNAEILWTAALERERKVCERNRRQRERLKSKIAKRLDQLTEAGNERGANELGAKARELLALSATLDAHELELAEFRVTLEMAYARPEKTVDTCSKLIEAIDGGKARKSDIRDRELIVGRQDAANLFCEEIDQIRDQCFVVIDPILDQVRNCQSRLGELNVELQPLLASDLPTPLPGISPHASKDGPVVADGQLALPPAKSPRDTVDSILDRILTDDRAIFAPDAHNPMYRVPGVSRDEFRLLSSPAYSAWVQARLAGIAHNQGLRMIAAARMLKKHGRAGLEAVADTDQNARRALQWLDAYSDQPTLQSYIASSAERQEGEIGVVGEKIIHGAVDAAPIAEQAPQQQVELNSFLDRPPLVTAAIVAQSAEELRGHAETCGTSEEVQPEARLDIEMVNGQSAIAVEPGASSDCPKEAPSIFLAAAQCPHGATSSTKVTQGDDPARAAHIAEYVNAIRTEPSLRLVVVNGITRVDPESMPGWHLTVSAFEDVDLVQSAIQERSAEQAKIARSNAARDAYRAQKRLLIVKELEAGRLSARREQGRWVVRGADEDLVSLANGWRDNNQLIAAFERSEIGGKVARAADPAGFIQSSDHTRPEGAEQTPSAGLLNVPREMAGTASPLETEEGYSIAQLHWFAKTKGTIGK